MLDLPQGKCVLGKRGCVRAFQRIFYSLGLSSLEFFCFFLQKSPAEDLNNYLQNNILKIYCIIVGLGPLIACSTLEWEKVTFYSLENGSM